MKKTTFSILKSILKIALASALIYWLIASDKINLNAIQLILAPEYLIPCFVLIFGNLFITSERWRFLLSRQDVILNRWSALKLTFIGLFFNFAMPGGVGGDVVKGVFIAKSQPEKKGVAAFSILMDRILGLYSMVLIAVISMFFDLSHVLATEALKMLFIFVVIFLLASSTFFALAFTKNEKLFTQIDLLLRKLPLGLKLARIYEILHSYGKKSSTFWNSILLSFIAQSFTVFFIILVGNAMGMTDVRWTTYFLVVPLGLIATALPIAPAGIGVGQAAFYFLFNLYLGYQTDLGPNVMTVMQIVMFCFGLVGAVLYMLRPASR